MFNPSEKRESYFCVILSPSADQKHALQRCGVLTPVRRRDGDGPGSKIAVTRRDDET